MAMNMCSNSGGTNACGCCGGGGSGGGSNSNGGGGGNGNGNGVSIWNSGSMKKQQQQKRPRIPKRGPGVAELEKILKEQETADVTPTQRGNNEGFSMSSSCYIPHPPQPQPSLRLNSNNFHSLLPLSQKIDLTVSPGIRSMYANSNMSPLGRNNGVGSIEHELFRRRNLNEVADGSPSESENSSSSESNHANCSYPGIVSRRNNVDPLPKMNEFHGNGGNQNGVLSIGLPNFSVESPSVQNSHYNYTSRSNDEQMMAGGRVKRSYSSSLDNSLIPPSNFQVLPSFSRHNRPQQSSTNESHGISSYNPTNECYRDTKWGNTLELSNKIFNSENVGSSHTKYPPFVVPEVPPPRPPLQFFQSNHSKVNRIPCQVTEDKVENSNEEDRKPFFNFLEVKGQEEVTDGTSGSNNGGDEGGRGGIDLTLKL
ncbi:unnamed protein product [Lathyrus sativus]|nr:unnamed protein product [Lathyrus sativus]